MQIVLDAAGENGWHKAWMAATRGSYEWWYADFISDDTDWSLVVIFLLGNPFSAYYRQSFLKEDSSPIDHNGVFFALHRRGQLRHYAFINYPAKAITNNGVGTGLSFGPNSFSFAIDSGFRAEFHEENANRRVLDAVVTLQPTSARSESPATVDPNAGHWWLPAIAAGRAEVDIAIRSLGASRAIERIKFSGSGYHDHNWGVLPFGREIDHWTWARSDFGDGKAALFYWTVEDGGRQTCSLLIFYRTSLPVVYENAIVNVEKWRISKFGTRSPKKVVIAIDNLLLSISTNELLEDVPFYVRYRHTATLTVDGVQQTGVGIGEFFKPAPLATPIVSSALTRRIYRPADGC